MTTVTGRDWKPINYLGSWHGDPRDELRARAQRADSGNDIYVAVPLALAMACAELRECGERGTLTSDEDGPLSEPVEIQCRRPVAHSDDHYNGYCSWKRDKGSSAPSQGVTE